MYIIPNTTIKLIRNCPLDPSYENTIFFNSESEQTNFFINILEGYKLQNNSYQRVNKGTMRVAVNAEHLYTCNYLAFQNASFGSKWFYAFITNIEYINNVTSEVTYELDVIQTWHFNYLLMPCFIEREHSLTDEIGDNIVDEKLDTGEYLVTDFSFPNDLDDIAYVLFCTVDEHYDDVNGFESQGLFSGLYPVTFQDDPDLFDPNYQSAAEKMTDWVEHLPVLKTEAIVSGCVMPYKLVHRPTEPSNFTHTVQKNTILRRNDGTQVKNNKCLTYPYNFLYVTNYQGKSAVYKYEFFDKSSNNITFYLKGGCNPNPSVFIYPYNYKIDVRTQLQNRHNTDEGFYLGGYPQVPWNIDSYKAWLAQSASAIGISTMSAGVNAETYMNANIASKAAVASAGAAVPAMAGMEAAALGGVAASVAVLAGLAISGTIHALMPPQSKGNISGAAQFQAGNMTFGFMNKHITPEFATIIDDYFNAYGYATHTIKVPYRTSRPEWNYIKTVGCKIDGGYPGDVTDTSSAITHVTGLPADDMRKIEAIYDRGITFWHNPAHIGDYSQDNSPVVP